MGVVTRYARSGDVHIAYQVFGSGSVDLIIAPGFVSQVEACWDGPGYARWLDQFGKYARVITFDKTFDKRRTGLSDRVSELPGLEQHKRAEKSYFWCGIKAASCSVYLSWTDQDRASMS